MRRWAASTIRLESSKERSSMREFPYNVRTRIASSSASAKLVSACSRRFRGRLDDRPECLGRPGMLAGAARPVHQLVGAPLPVLGAQGVALEQGVRARGVHAHEAVANA